MYGLHGEHHLEEVDLPHLSGYMGTKPVRIGNRAFQQKQLDIYGELMDTVYLAVMHTHPLTRPTVVLMLYSLWLVCYVE